jgi:hypothetical protein
MAQGQPRLDSGLVTAQMTGEGGQRGKAVVFDVGDPLLEMLAGQPGEHGREPSDMAGEPVQLRRVGTESGQLVGVVGGQPVGVGHDPGGDLADRGWFRSRHRGVPAAVAEAAQVALHGQFSAGVAEGGDLAEQGRGVAFALVPALVQVLAVVVDEVGALFGLGDYSSTVGALAILRTVAGCRPSRRPIADFDSPCARS